MLLDHVNGKQNKIICCFPQNTEFGNPLSDWFFIISLYDHKYLCNVYEK